MRGRVGKGAVGTLVLAMSTGLSLVAPAHAQGTDRSQVNGKTPYYIVEDEDRLAAETVNKFQNLQIGPISIASIYSKLHVDFVPGVEPKVTYAIQFTGIRNAADPAGALTSEGFFMGGKNLTGDDWIKQFN